MKLKRKLVKSLLYIILGDIDSKGFNNDLQFINIDKYMIAYLLETDNSSKNPFDNALFKIRAKIELEEEIIFAFYYRDYKNKFYDINLKEYKEKILNQDDFKIAFTSNGKYEIIKDNIKEFNKETIEKIIIKKKD